MMEEKKIKEKKKEEGITKIAVLNALWASGELQRDLLCGISTLFLLFFSAAANYTTYTHITHSLTFPLT